MTVKPLMVAVSDATGETAEQCCRAALAQFGTFPEGTVHTVPNVLDVDALERAVLRAKSFGVVLVYTLVGRDLRHAIKDLASKHEVVVHDMLGSLIREVATQLDRKALNVPGLGHELDEAYFRRVEAVEFAVYNDDGKSPSNLAKADIVIVGISRTSKTPLSNYIAHRGLKVANVPIVMEVTPPVELDDVDPKRVFGLLIDPVTLRNIRKARMEGLGMHADSGYGDLREIRREIMFAKRLYDRHPGWTVIDISRKAVEETATTIIEHYRERFVHEAGTGEAAEGSA